MLYTHFCKSCSRVYLLSGHRESCPACDHPLRELEMGYLDYVNLNREKREVLMASLLEEEGMDAES